MSCQRSIAWGVLALINVSPGVSCRDDPLVLAYRQADPYEGLAGRPVATHSSLAAQTIGLTYLHMIFPSLMRGDQSLESPAVLFPTATLRPEQYQSPGDKQFAKGGFCGHKFSYQINLLICRQRTFAGIPHRRVGTSIIGSLHVPSVASWALCVLILSGCYGYCAIALVTMILRYFGDRSAGFPISLCIQRRRSWQWLQW